MTGHCKTCQNLPHHIGWRVWYADGASYSSADISWDVLPDDGVIVLVLYEDFFGPDGKPRREIQSGADYYFCAPGAHGMIYGFNALGPDVIRKRYPGASVKSGKWTDRATLELCLTAARDAVDAP